MERDGFMKNKDTVKIFIMKQVKLYIENGVKPIDVLYDERYDTLVYVFNKDETKDIYKKWLALKD